MSNKKTGMSEETYKLISENMHLFKLDLQNGSILNRNIKSTTTYGYYRISLAGKRVFLHQILAVARWGTDCIGMTVNHINECRTDNSWNNLELLKHEDNVRVKMHSSGSCIPKQPVKAINIDTGESHIFESVREAGRQLNLQSVSISRVIKGKRNRTGRYTFEKIIS